MAAFHELVGYIEVLLKVKEHTMEIFFDIKRDFFNTKPSLILTTLYILIINKVIVGLVETGSLLLN